MVLCYRKLPKSFLKIQTREVFRTAQTAEDVVDTGKRVDVSQSDRIKPAVVHAETKFLVRLSDEDDRTAPRAGRRSNDVVFQHLVYLFSNNRSLRL